MRLHGHAGIIPHNRYAPNPDEKYWVWKGVAPHAVHKVAKVHARKACERVLFYVSIPTEGAVLQWHNAAPFEDYRAAPQWIRDLYQGEKVTASTARMLLV